MILAPKCPGWYRTITCTKIATRKSCQFVEEATSVPVWYSCFKITLPLLGSIFKHRSNIEGYMFRPCRSNPLTAHSISVSAYCSNGKAWSLWRSHGESQVKRCLGARVSSGRDRDKGSQGKGRKVSVRRNGGTCVGLFARANIQHPQAEEAVKQMERGTAAPTVKGAQKGT